MRQIYTLEFLHTSKGQLTPENTYYIRVTLLRLPNSSALVKEIFLMDRVLKNDNIGFIFINCMQFCKFFFISKINVNISREGKIS